MEPARLLEPRTSKRRFAVVAVFLALAGAGCGGSEIEYQEVPGEPVEITLPERTPAGDTDADAAATDGDAATAETTPTPTATPADATGATTDGTATTEGETTTPEATPAPAEDGPATAEDGPATDEPPVPGSDAERFEDFCEQNAGAC